MVIPVGYIDLVWKWVDMEETENIFTFFFLFIGDGYCWQRNVGQETWRKIYLPSDGSVDGVSRNSLFIVQAVFDLAQATKWVNASKPKALR